MSYSDPGTPSGMKKALSVELKNSVWLSMQILDNVLPVDPIFLKDVMASCKRDAFYIAERLPRIRLDGHSHLSDWPTAGAQESSHYGPLSALLNGVLKLAQDLISRAKRKIYFPDITCANYDREMPLRHVGERGGELEGSRNALKPDLLMFSGELPSNKDFSWSLVDVFMEAKDDWPDLLWQAATYADCMFAVPVTPMQVYRRFVMALLFNHKTMEFSFACFHRSGCTRTPPISLTSHEGFDRLIRVLVGIKSIASMEAAGYDESAMSGPLLKNHKFGKVICQREGVSGRMTNVTRRALNEHDLTPNEDSDKQVDDITATIEETTVYDAKRSESFAEAQAEQIEAPPPPPPRLLPLIIPGPDEQLFYIVKDWWSSELSNNEGEMFGSLRNKFGIPKVKQSHPVDLLHGERGRDTTRQFVPEDAKLDPICIPKPQPTPPKEERPASAAARARWRAAAERARANGGSNKGSDQRKSNTRMASRGASEMPKESEPVLRVHMRTIFETAGIPLEYAISPRKMFKALAHAIIGHWNMFKNDWLHRDVSLGNVMILEAPELREHVLDFDDPLIGLTTQAECEGMVIDGDHAIRWWCRIRECPISGHRSGTLPYLSLRLCQLWGDNNPVSLPHTALDDLESFLWVLLHAILLNLPEFETGNQWLQHLAEEHCPTLYSLKDSISSHILRWGKLGREAPALLEPYAKVLPVLFEIAQRAEFEAKKLVSAPPGIRREEILKTCQSFYEEYLSALLRNLHTIPAEWPEDNDWTEEQDNEVVDAWRPQQPIPLKF